MKTIKFKHWVYITKIKRENEYYQRLDRMANSLIKFYYDSFKKSKL